MPADHEMFGELNPAQWLWYYHNISKDEDEEFEFQRDLIEYLAGFIEPQAVQKIRDQRARKNVVAVDSPGFASGIEQIFGRKLNIKGEPIAYQDPKQVSSGIDIANIVNNFSGTPTKKDPSLNYRHWLNLDLE